MGVCTVGPTLTSRQFANMSSIYCRVIRRCLLGGGGGPHRDLTQAFTALNERSLGAGNPRGLGCGKDRGDVLVRSADIGAESWQIQSGNKSGEHSRSAVSIPVGVCGMHPFMYCGYNGGHCGHKVVHCGHNSKALCTQCQAFWVQCPACGWDSRTKMARKLRSKESLEGKRHQQRTLARVTLAFRDYIMHAVKTNNHVFALQRRAKVMQHSTAERKRKLRATVHVCFHFGFFFAADAVLLVLGIMSHV